jgi:heme exporter protein CcmD
MHVSLRFETLEEFIQMSGYGPWVWGSYGIFTCSLIGLVWYLRVKRRNTLRKLKQFYQRVELENS